MKVELAANGEINANKRKYKILVTWEVENTIEIEASSLEEAIEEVEKMDHLPIEGATYVDESFRIVKYAVKEINEKDE